MTYPEALAFLDTLPNWEKLAQAGEHFSLEHFREFLTRIGSPQEKLRNVILVAGTKGKGSTCAMIESLLEVSGLTVGRYTSPHVLEVRERLSIGHGTITKSAFARYVKEMKPVVEQTPITWFEAMTTIAFRFFTELDVDAAVLEIGLGGRLDATNVANPRISVITRIGLDHTEILGKTLAEIATEKAGIIHPNGVVVVAEQPPEALATIRAEVNRRNARMLYVPDEWTARRISVRLDGTRFTLVPKSRRARAPMQVSLRMIGRHQVENALTALTVLSAIIPPRSRRGRFYLAAETGLELAIPLRARCEIVRPDPFLMVDGAHNPDSIQALVRVLRDLRVAPVTVILGLLRDKPVEEILKLLKPVTAQLIAVQPDSQRALPAAELREAAERLGIPVEMTRSLERTLGSMSQPAVVTGSFYLAGEALRIVESWSEDEPWSEEDWYL